MFTMFSIFKEHRHNAKQIFMLALFTLFIYWFAFSFGIRASGDIAGLPRFIFMLVGFIPWFFISDSILFGSQSIRKNRQFVVKMYFPVSNIMTFTLLEKFMVHLLLCGLMVIYLCFAGYWPSVYTLQFFYYCPLMFLFFLALSWSTAPMSAFSRDFENFIKSIMTGLFWLSSVMWDSYTPINYFVNGYRKAFVSQEWFWEYPQETLIFLAELVVVMLLGMYNYKRLRKRLPDVL